jgi:hypothetical protein
MLGVFKLPKVIAEIGFIARRQKRADQDEVGNAGAQRAKCGVLAVRQNALRADALAQHTFHHASLHGVRLDDEHECQIRSSA